MPYRSSRPLVATLAVAAIVAGACGGGAVVADHHRGALEPPRPQDHGMAGTSTTPSGAAPAAGLPRTTATAPAALGALVVQSPPSGAYRVLVPVGWRYTDTSYPSDHTTEVWRDPADPGPALTVVRSGCSGCVETSINQPTPDPSLVLPAGVTQRTTVDQWTLDYRAAASASGDVDFGRVEILHDGARITGYVRLDLVLAQGDEAVASRILDSFAIAAP